METLTGTINKVIYTNPENDFKIFEVRRSDRSVIRVKGDFPTLLMGAKVQVHGKFESHHKYGLSFKSDAHSFDFDNSVKSIAIYIMSIAKWVGHERAEALAEKFGADLEKVIEETPNRLTEVDGIGEKVAANIVEAWEMNRSLKGIKIFLFGLGLSENRVKKILNLFGINSEEVLKGNPWLLCFHGFGFSTCDFIAQKLEKSMQEPDRYKYYILHTLRECNSFGHLYLSPSQILESFNKYNKAATFPFKSTDLILEDIAPHVKSLVSEGLILNDSNRIYEVSNFFYENESARLLTKMMSTVEESNLDGVDIEGYITEYEKSHSITFSDAQRDAVRAFTTEKVLVITGSPGSGKTTLVKALVMLMKLRGMQFELLTPTGISAKKLGNTAGNEAYTIHRRLGYKGDVWDYGALQKYPTDVVVVDEVSMVDMEVFYRLISAMYSRTRMVFVGDNDQLPSVGPGSVLKELILSGEIKTVRLETIFRQSEQSDIIKAAKKIRDGDTDLSLFKDDKFADIWHIRSSDSDKIEKLIVNFSLQFKDIAKTKGEKAGFQIITPRNEGPCSVESLNKVLQEALNPKADDKKEITIGKNILRKGDRVIIKKNNYQLDVFNGDIGKVSFITLDSVVIDLEDFFDKSRRVEIPVKIADEMIRLAYAISVHRCVPWYSRVSTLSGMKKIIDIEIGDLVYSTGGPKKVLWHGNVGVKNNIKITTRSGFKIYGAEDHKFLIPDNGYRNITDLKIGDFLCIPLEVIPGGPIPINHTNTFYKCFKKPVYLPHYFDENLCWLLGVIIGDGNYTDEDDGVVEIAGKCKLEILDRAQKILEGYGLRVCDHYKKGKLAAKYVCSRNFRDWLLSIGVGYVTAREKSVPDVLFQASKECRAAFIAGLIDTDGCHDKRAVIRYTTASERLSLDLQQLLLMHGIVSNRGIERGEPEIAYKVIVSGMDYDKFARILKLTMVGKAKRLEKYSVKISNRSNYYEIPINNPAAIVDKFLLAFRMNEGPSRGIKGKGLYSKYKNLFISLFAIKRGVNKLRKPIIENMKIISEKEGFYLPYEIQDIIDKNYYYDPIVSIEACGKEEMYDIEVEGEHSYVTQGALCHNSQGLEYPFILLPLIKAHGNLILQRNLLYTALTRAKKKAIVIGQSSAIESAIANDKIQKRNTLFAERLKMWQSGKGLTLSSIFENLPESKEQQRVKTLLSYENQG